MTLQIEIEECQRNLDFEPELPWADLLPAFCYQIERRWELLCGFDRKCGFALPLSGNNLPQTLKAIYPVMSFVELARLSSLLPLESTDRSELWTLYGYRWKESLAAVVNKVIHLPLCTQKWLQLKRLGPQDLAPLRSLEKTDQLEEFWPHFTRLNLSKTEGAKVLELLVELLLLGTTAAELAPEGTGDQWCKALIGKRFPLTTNQDKLAETKIRTLAWPLKTEAHWTRRGDRSGVELKMFFSHPQELRRSLDRLEQVCTDLQEHSEYEDLWSKS
jgi:hypothetical protein